MNLKYGLMKAEEKDAMAWICEIAVVCTELKNSNRITLPEKYNDLHSFFELYMEVYESWQAVNEQNDEWIYISEFAQECFLKQYSTVNTKQINLTQQTIEEYGYTVGVINDGLNQGVRVAHKVDEFEVITERHRETGEITVRAYDDNKDEPVLIYKHGQDEASKPLTERFPHVKEDIDVVLKHEGKEDVILTSEEYEDLINTILGFDYSDYNDKIADEVDKVLEAR